MLKNKKTTLEKLARMIAKGFEENTENFGIVSKEIKEIKKEITEIKFDLDNIKLRMGEMAFRFEIQGIEKRLKRLEIKAGIK